MSESNFFVLLLLIIGAYCVYLKSSYFHYAHPLQHVHEYLYADQKESHHIILAGQPEDTRYLMARCQLGKPRRPVKQNREISDFSYQSGEFLNDGWIVKRLLIHCAKQEWQCKEDGGVISEENKENKENKENMGGLSIGSMRDPVVQFVEMWANLTEHDGSQNLTTLTNLIRALNRYSNRMDTQLSVENLRLYSRLTNVQARRFGWEESEPTDEKHLCKLDATLHSFDLILITDVELKCAALLRTHLGWPRRTFDITAEQRMEIISRSPARHLIKGLHASDITKLERVQHLDMALFERAKTMFASYEYSDIERL